MEDVQVYRRYDMEAPEYGDDSDKFSVSIDHNGFFCNIHDPIEYMDGTMDFFDNCSTETWSLLWINDFVKQLGHLITDRLKVYWCLPGKKVTDGLVYTENDAVIVAMIDAVKENKTLTILVDHTNFLHVLRPDCIVKLGVEVASSSGQGNASSSGLGNASSSCVISAAEIDTGNAGDEETDSEFYDSDFDAEDGDDDMFEANVDKELNDHNEIQDIIENEDDAGLEHEDIHLTKEQHLELTYKFRQSNPEVDMEMPEFKVGMIFSCVKELRGAIKSYSISERVKVRKSINEATRIEAVCDGDCDDGCPWFLKASAPTRGDARGGRNARGRGGSTSAPTRAQTTLLDLNEAIGSQEMQEEVLVT